ncbi:MAG: RHS repeat-associated core domain-containing protein, partial [Patescibacteria group bacterium]
NANDGTVFATYEFGPFGELLRFTGSMAKINPFRFSTKYQDDETGLLYYGHRYYSPSTGRWPSRDPLGEQGGRNIYTFSKNNQINTVDVLGLHDFALITAPGHFEPKKPWPGIPGRFKGGEEEFTLSDHTHVEKVKGMWYVRAGYTSHIDFWYSGPSEMTHELVHVADD